MYFGGEIVSEATKYKSKTKFTLVFGIYRLGLLYNLIYFKLHLIMIMYFSSSSRFLRDSGMSSSLTSANTCSVRQTSDVNALFIGIGFVMCN